MAFHSSASLSNLAKKAASMHQRLASVKEKAEETMGQAIQVAETVGAAGAMGYVNAKMGKDGEFRVGNVPLDLGLAAAGLGMALFGALGKYGEHGVNLAAGCGAAYAYRMGEKMGTQAKTSGVTGALPAAERAKWAEYYRGHSAAAHAHAPGQQGR